MSYRIYLQIPNGSAFERTETGSRAIAESVFQSFLERDELDRKEVSVHLVYQRGGPTCLDRKRWVLSGTLLMMGFAHFPMPRFA
jgi:hypothetical protein